ncbi:MAG: SDR family NAD(P)-dependent oxidoreductase [Rhodothermaceae bacterium]|nr:SDR family NAD(P)-dependent oxidoreductase [Rhodothermaceae bacterium]
MNQDKAPLAIVGMACKFPGAASIQDYWRLLVSGQNSVMDIPKGAGNRRIDVMFADIPNLPDACRFCSYLDDIEQFDPQFFRISPVEANWLDPQQRMMVETSWRALEDAGIDPLGLKGSLTGVYTGISNYEYRMRIVESNHKPVDAASSLYAMSGTSMSGPNGRVSFFLGLRGPSKAIDAACASSLVAVNDAVSDLQRGKTDMAIVGGVQSILSGHVFKIRADAGILSPDGQCKVFDASANGYVRGEGCGVVVLKRLQEAEADGDKIWAVIKGSAVNHGGDSVGMTVPHIPALEQVMGQALRDAGVTAAEVDYVEAHGTGTSVGDPIELEAMSTVYGQGRAPDRPLLVGSVKTNIGHLESAAGIAGLIKAVLVLQRGVIPKHLHFHNPTPAVDWDKMNLRVTSEMMDLPAANGRPRIAGINSFGISGTNSHIILEEYLAKNGTSNDRNRVINVPQTVSASGERESPLSDGEVTPQRQVRLLPLSGKSPAALQSIAGNYMQWLDERGQEVTLNGSAAAPLFADMAWTAAMGRSHFEYRSGVVFQDEVSLRQKLTALADSAENIRPQAATKIAFAYTGQGSQWTGMGRAIYECEPVARAVFDRCEAVFQAERKLSLLDAIFGRTDCDLSNTAWEQPALYALECALTALWASIGIQPSVVIGHSVGELAAAQAAGVFSLEDGMRFAITRGALFAETDPGAMAAVFAPPAQVASAVEEINASTPGIGLSVSANNGTHQVVSGPIPRIQSIIEHFESEGIRVKRLNTSKAFHSAMMEPVLDTLEASLSEIAIQAPSLKVVSNLTGEVVGSGQTLDGAYWRRHGREAVAFALGVQTLSELGVDLIIEVGPRPILTNMVALAWPESQTPPFMISSLQVPSGDMPEDAATSDFQQAVAQAYQAGLTIQFEGLFAGEVRRRIQLPGYPFLRDHYWIKESKRRGFSAGDHPLLGSRRDFASGEVVYETEVFRSSPNWLQDHQVFGRVIAPGALYGAMAASACLTEGSGLVIVEDMQLHNALVFPEQKSSDSEDDDGREMQILIAPAEAEKPQRIQIFSRGEGEDWVMHVEGSLSSATAMPEESGQVNLEDLRAGMSTGSASSYYQARADTGIDLRSSFRTLKRFWYKPGEAVGEVSFPDTIESNELDIHPLILDGCFQVVAAARNPGGVEGETTYLPFGWDRLWLSGRLPNNVVCHVRMKEVSKGAKEKSGSTAEIMSAELRIYDTDGTLIGGLSGYIVKRATRGALLSAVEDIDDLLYEILWRESPLVPAVLSADFLPSPGTVAASSGLLSAYLSEEGVQPEERNALLDDLERWSRSRALATLEELGWKRKQGDIIESEVLRKRLGVISDHERVFRRMLEMLAKSGIVEELDGSFVVRIASGDALPDEMPVDLEEFADGMAERFPHGTTEVGLFRRCGTALGEVLRAQKDPLTLLFSSGDPTPGDLYLKAPVARAANRILKETVSALVSELPAERHLRIIEVGAGTGSATAAILPELPEGRFDYMYTDISAGFFAEAEARFGGKPMEYRPLNIENDPVAQGFEMHSYDLLIASNVIHATRYLHETLEYCRDLLAPSGQLVALENLSGQGWMDLTFGQLDGWWRFADDYRPHHALASPAVWRRALSDAGFGEVEILGIEETDAIRRHDKGVIVAQGPTEIQERTGVWVLVADHNGTAQCLAEDLVSNNQTVVLVEAGVADSKNLALESEEPGMIQVAIDISCRESWEELLRSVSKDLPLKGVVHLGALDGAGPNASTDEMAQDTRRIVESALVLVQAVIDTNVLPDKGIWFITRGAQVLEREFTGQIAGAALWGFGKGVSRELTHLQTRMIDLDPAETAAKPDLVTELLNPDHENHIAYRNGRRNVARLARENAGLERLSFPNDAPWVLAPDPDGVIENIHVKTLSHRGLEPKEVRVAVKAAGLNFWDVFRSLAFIQEGNLGREVCGDVLEIGSEVTTVSVGDHVVGLGFGAFAAEMVTHGELVARAPEGFSVSEMATVPSAFVSAALSYEFSGLEAGDRVLIHAGAGGVGLAAIQLAQAVGAEVFATASAPKQKYLRSLGVEHVFNSRDTLFGAEILEATDGEGIDVVLNSLTSEGFIDASLSCLVQGGRFVELARRDILSEEEMAAVRPDVKYAILELDVLKKTDPEWVGRVLRNLLKQFSEGSLTPIRHSRWPLAEASAALQFMRSARHLGKIVVTTSALVRGQLRGDRTYLVTGGLGGIGLAVANWLADHGAGAIVLNGRRPPEGEAQEVVDSLQARGVTVRVALADVTDLDAVDKMLADIREELPPLAGVIHSVGVLSDGALGNQTWDRFEQVLWPKVVGAWHLHRATADCDLDLFVLFSSRVGVMGNPGQANHATANAFLDQLAAHRRAIGLPGQAIAWGAWSEIGEAAERKESIEERRAALGGRWFTPQQGIKALDKLVRADVTHSVVMAMDWEVFQKASEDRPAILGDLLQDTSEEEADTTVFLEDPISQLRRMPAAEHKDLLISFLQQELQAVLRLPSAPSSTVGFFDLGMDSLMAVELRNRLNRAFADEYVASNTVVFDYPDINMLAEHLADELGSLGPAPAPLQLVTQQQPVVRNEEDGIAVIGMACRFPGAPDIEAFWELLESGGNTVSDGRPDSGPWEGVAGDPAADDPILRLGSFLDGLDQFDAGFFNIRPIEARGMDPRQRMLLETSWQALEDAAMDPDSLRHSRTGTYIGMAASEYRDLISGSDQEYNYLGTAGSVAIGRVAFLLGLMGPAVAVDMTCASSLAAIHQAASDLKSGDVDLALTGGVHVVLSPAINRFMAEYGMLSSSGNCRTFDASADGFVRGEGCGVVILKRLSDAVSDGDRIWGVIRGSALNQNGPSASLTVPSGQAQKQVLEDALRRAGIPPSEVDFLEAHGTGSQLGDPIEVNSVASVYGRDREADRPLLLGTAKTNIGHLESAAGVAGLIKVLLAMERRVIPKHLHFEEPNPHVEWDQLPVKVTSEKIDWPSRADRPPRAGVSAFAISGANAHVVVEGYSVPGDSGLCVPIGSPEYIAVPDLKMGVNLPDPVDEDQRRMRVLPLSAKSNEALQALAGGYLSWLDEHFKKPPEKNSDALLSDMAWTAAVGRSHLSHRAGITYDDEQSLRNGLMSVASTNGRLPVPEIAPKVAFVFNAEETLGLEMGEELYRSEPVVRAVLDRCDELLQGEFGGSLLDVMFGRSNNLSDSEVWRSPAVFALQCAQVALWESVGVSPDVVVGISTGELAAAYAAGVLKLEDGLVLAARCTELMDGYLENGNAQAILEEVSFAPPSTQMVSGSTGLQVSPELSMDAAYWTRQTRSPAALGKCVATIAKMGVTAVVEVGPDMLLKSKILSDWPKVAQQTTNGVQVPIVLASFKRPRNGSTDGSMGSSFSQSVARLYEAGLKLNFSGLFAGEKRSRISLPSYPFQREHYWFKT